MSARGRQLTLAVTFAAACAAAPASAASLVGTTTTVDAFSSATRFYTHCANGYCWVAFHNGTQPVIYSSPDGATWTSQGNIFSAVVPASAGQWATRFSGTRVIAFGTNPVNPRRRWYRNATLNNSGTVTWDAADNQAISAAGQLEVNSLIANNKPIIYFVDPTSWGDEVIGSQFNAPTWNNPPQTPPSIFGASGGGFSAAAMFPTGGADPNDYILLRATTTTPYTAGAHRLLADRYDASAPVYISNLQWYDVSRNGLPPGGPFGYAETMDTEVKEGTDAQAHMRFGAVRDTSGNVHAVYVNRNDNVVHYKKAVGFNDSWSRLFIDVTASASAIDRVALGAVGSNNLILFYSKSDNGIYYKRFDGTNWGGETVAKAANAVTLRGAFAPMEMALGCSLGIAWVEGAGSPYSVMYESVGGCGTLSTSVSGTKITVDTNAVRMVWDSAGGAGGGLNEFYVKGEANPLVNRSGDPVGYNLFSTQIWDVNWQFEGYDAVAGLPKTGAVTPLEVTPTRVKLRQNYDYTAVSHLQRDWTTYGYPRLAINERLTFDNTTNRRGTTGLHAKGEPTCPGNTFFCAAAGNSTDKVWIVSDDLGTYSDVLAIPYLVPSDPFFARQGAVAWTAGYEPNTVNGWLARVFEGFGTEQATGPGVFTNFYAFYPALAGITTAGSEWQPYANDYRTPDELTINGATGSKWTDANENTTGGTDYFNEAEAAYVLDLKPGSGLDLSIDGSAGTPRKKPFFKVRQWRSLQDPTSVTFNGTTLVNDLDFKADVKPFARAYSCIPACTQRANGGLVGDASEFLNDGSAAKNLQLPFTGANFLYLGADVKFRGINVALATVGLGTADLQWEYWNGASWANLEAVSGFFDETDSLKKNGTIYWGDDATETDPGSWAPTVVSGSPSLYFVRASLSSGSYTQLPVESLIRTDVLLLQFCGADITSAGQTLVVGPPITTAVTLQSFGATGRDGGVDLSWTTGSELKNLGFYLYRSTSAEGPYERITSSLIPGLGSSATGTSYSYRDVGLQNGVTYFYQLEDVESTGRTERHGPVSATSSADASDGEGGSGDPGEGGRGDPGGSGNDPTRWKHYGEDSGASLWVIERGPTHAVLELVTPGFWAETQDDGTVRLQIPGFEEASLPGAPAVPLRRALVEALAGKRVRVSTVTPSDLLTFDTLKLATTGAPELEVNGQGVVKARRAAHSLSPQYRKGGYYPRLWARLVGSLFQGETKKAEIELSPLRFDPVSGKTVLARKLLVRVEFSGADSKEISLGGSRGRRAGSSVRSRGVVAQIVTPQTGLYRVRFEDVFGDSRRGVPAASLRLSHRGQGVAYHLEPDRASFAPGSSLFFVSQASNAYGDAVYELELGKSALRMPVTNGAPSGPTTLEYMEKRVLELNKLYQSGLLDAPDLWLWDTIVAPATKSYSFTLDQLSPSSTPSHLQVVLQGGSDFDLVLDHHLRASLNGIPVGETTWDGKWEQILDMEVAPGILLEGNNILALQNVGDAGASSSMVFLNRFTLRYPRRPEATGGSLLGEFEPSGQVEVKGIAAPAFVVDTTTSSWVKGGVPTLDGVSFRAEAGASYRVVTDASLLVPTVRKAASSGLRSTANRADWMLIAPREFLPAAKPLVELRRSQGLKTKTVAVEDVFSEFGYGEASAQAIKDFLSYAYQSWKKPSLKYVVLLGDSTYDPKNYLNTTFKDRIPTPYLKTTYMWTASDLALAAVNGEDLIPDFAIGRLSATTLAQAETLVSKILAFEQAGQTLDGTAIMVADNADIAGNFEADIDEAILSLAPARDVNKIFLSELGPAATRAEIRGALEAGAGLISYVGHGSTVVWATENVFNNMDLTTLSPQPKQPFLLTWNCLNGFFHLPSLDSLAEAFVKAPGKGAIAAFSPSGLSVDEPAQIFHRAMLQELESGNHARLGDAIFAAQQTYADSGAFPELLSIYHLFGDPALKIR